MLLALIVVAMISMGQNRSGKISTGRNTLNLPINFSILDTIDASETYWIMVDCNQLYAHTQTVSLTLDSISGAPSLSISLEGKVTSLDDYTEIVSAATWDEEADNPFSMVVSSANKYRYFKIKIVASGATQKSRPTAISFTDTYQNTTSILATTAAFSGDVLIGQTTANETTPSLTIKSDADSDAGGDTNESLIIDLTPNATPTSAVWDFTSTQSSGYKFDKSLTVGLATPNETTPTLSIRGDADSDAADVTEALAVVLTPNATPTSAIWDITSTQSAGYRLDKSLVVGLAAPDETLPVLSIRGDADSDAADVTEVMSTVLVPSATETNAYWYTTSTQGAGYRYDKSVNIGLATPDETLPRLTITGDADSDAPDVTETLALVLTPNATETSATWGFTSTQSAGYTFDKATTWNGSTSGAIKIAPIATGTATTTIQNQNVSAATITLPSATCTLPGLGLANTFSGVNSFTGGLMLSTNSTVHWAKGGSITTATTGTDVAATNGGRFWVELEIPYNITVTGLAYLVGSVGGTDSVVVQLCNSAGVQVATSRAVGGAAALVGTAAEFQSVPFTTPYSAVGGKYFAVIQFNGTTAKFRAYEIPGMKFVANTAVGTWQTAAGISPGSTYVAAKGPILMTY